MDCHSWGGYDKQYGMFAVDRTTLERTFKVGAQYFIDVVNTFAKRV
jgi:beta-glucosidase/6-phospho-beta-glucosidase/beta-galactosidase